MAFGAFGLAGRSSGSRAVAGRAAQCVLLVLLSVALLTLVGLYADGLRDARYLDGWMLAAGMILQLGLHVAIKARRPARSVARWRTAHIFTGLLLIAAFLSHTDFSMPDSGLEWALWSGFALVTLSGVLGAFLAWSLQARRRIDERIVFDRIPARRAELMREAEAAVLHGDVPATAVDLPAPPYEAWIADLYTTRLQDFFAGPRHAAAHLLGSQHPLRQLTDAIDELQRYVDKPNRARLATLRDLVVEKDRLDFARVHLAITRGLLFVHVPVTYALVVLSLVHGVVAYAYSSGAW